MTDLAGKLNSGTAKGATPLTLTLADNASSVMDAYKGMSLNLLTGSGSIQERIIASYDGPTKVATVDVRWRTNRLRYSEQLENAVWTKTGLTVDSNAIKNSDGELFADALIETDQRTYQFTASADGWTATNATLTPGATTAVLTSTAVDGYMSRTGLSFSGAAFRYVTARIKRLTPGAVWKGRVYYSTAGHGFTDSYYKDIVLPPGADDDFVELTWDMHALTIGGTDWSINTITGLRIDFSADNGASFEVDWISHDATAHDITQANLAGSVDDDTMLVVAEVKQGNNGSGVQLYYQRRDTVANWNSTFFDFENKVIRDTSYNCEAGFEEKSDGWFLIWLKGPLNSGSTIPDFGARAVRSFDPLNTIYVGDGATIPFYLTRAQAEFSLALDGYIKTEAAAISLPDITTTYEVVDEDGEVNHLAGMQSRLPHWLRSAGNLNALLEASADPYRQIEIAFLDLRRLRAVDVASGVQLDGIGEIINVPRVPAQSDESYRYALKTAMIILTKSGEPEAVIEAYLGVTGGVVASYTEIYPATFQIATQPTVDASDPDIAAFINQTMQAIKPAGVGMILTTLDGFTLADVSEVDINNNGPSDANKGFGSSVPAETGGGGLARVI